MMKFRFSQNHLAPRAIGRRMAVGSALARAVREARGVFRPHVVSSAKLYRRHARHRKRVIADLLDS